MGGKTSTSTSTQTIPKEVMTRYGRVNRMAEKAANQKFRPYKGDFVADVNQQQLAGIDTINNSVNKADPYFQQSQDYLQRGSGTAQAGELDIAKYYNPYQSEVVDSTAALIDQGNEQAMSGSLGDLIKSGGFGGDRAGVSSAILAGQQQAQRAKTLADIKQQGYQQAVGTAQQQQGVDLAARQADLARLLQASGQSTQTGVAAQQAGLAGGEAQINAGTLQQQTQQAENTAQYQQFLQKRGYPFQVAQFLANIAMGTGSLSGSTTTTEQPAPFFSDRRLKTDIKRIGRSTDGKLPIYSYKYKGDDETHIGFMADEVEKVKPEAVGQSHGYKTVDYDRATRAEGGAVYGQSVADAPFDGGYVPDGYLKVGSLEPVRPVSGPPQSAMAGLKELWDTGNSAWDAGKQVAGWFDDAPTKAEGGVVGASYLASPPQIAEPDDPLADVVEKGGDQGTPKLEPTPTAGAAPQSGASGVGSLLSGIASIFALSDPRVKKDAKKIGSTDDGMPIYKFKYKGRDHTHIGFMADDVEERKPEAVARGVDGLRYVDYERASRAEGGVIPVPTLYREEAPPEVDLAPLREAIASKESPNYYTIHGGEKFHSYDDHPRENVKLKDGNTSSAAGRYQMIAPTWDAAAKKLGLTNFSPRNQDRAADYVAREDYGRRTGSDLGSDIATGKLGDVRRGLTKTWRGLENLTDEDFAKFFEPKNAEYLAPREDRAAGGGVRPRFADGGVQQLLEPDAPSDAVYGEIVEPIAATDYKETPRRYSPPGMKVSELDGQTLVKDPVKPLETRTLGVTPKVAVSDTSDEKPLVSVDRYAKVVNSGKGWTEVLDPEGKVIRREGARNWRNNNPGNIEYGDFAKRLGAIGTDGRFAVFPTYEDGRKAKENLLFESPGYKDKSIRNAIYRYAPPSENNSDAYVAAVARKIGVDPDTALSSLQPEQRSIMMDAMQEVEGFRPGRTIVDGVQSVADATTRGVKALDNGARDVVTGVKDVAGDVVSGVKSVANTTGDFIKDTGGGMKDFLSRNKGNTDMILSILSGLGTMASSDSRYLGSALLQGLGGGAKTYADLQKQSADIRQTDAETANKGIQSIFDSIKPVDGVNHIVREDGALVPFWDAVQDKDFRGIGGKLLDQSVRKMAIDAYRQGKDPNTIKFGETVQTTPVAAAQVEGTPDDPTGGQIVATPAVTSEPSGVLWDKGSQDAIERNREILSRQGNMIAPEVERTTKVIIPQAQAAADASASNQLGLQDQVTTVAQAIAANNIGTGGDAWAKYWVQPLNTIARAAGLEPISATDDADTQRIKLGKIAALNADAFKPEDQNAYAALEMFRDISPNLEMTPQAASDITAQQMIMNQGPMDKAAYYNEVLRQSPAGRGVITSSNDAAFRDAYGPVYQKEKHDISELLRMAGENPKIADFIKGATTGALKPKDIQDGFEYYLGRKPSTGILYRYFQRG